MRLAVRRAAWSSSLEAALLLAAPAPAVRHAVLRIEDSGLEAALVLAALAPAMRDAVLRIASCRLGAGCRSEAAHTPAPKKSSSADMTKLPKVDTNYTALSHALTSD
jgi:hypothetical protein